MNGLGDKKPSELMDEMLVLADNHQNCPLFEQIFLEQLPEDIRLQLANDDFTDTRKIALKADVGETGAPWTPIFHFGFASNIFVAH